MKLNLEFFIKILDSSVNSGMVIALELTKFKIISKKYLNLHLSKISHPSQGKRIYNKECL